MIRRAFILLALLLSGSAEAFDFDPFYARFASKDGATGFALRPFYSAVDDPAHATWVRDVLWPVYTRRGFKDEVSGRLLLFGFSKDFSPETERKRMWVLPFWFQGTDAQGEDYVALFPLGGTIHEFFGRDEVSFVLFPLYGRSRINDLQTTSVLWPIGSRTVGPGVERFRVWPFYGTSTRAGRFEKKFVLWPVYTSVRSMAPDHPGGGFMLFPLYGQVKTDRGVNYWVAPPFFRYARSEEQRIVHAPWPFVQLADGEIEKFYLWPLYGRKEVGTARSHFFCWPIGWSSTVERPDYTQRRRTLAPLFFYESATATETTDTQVEDEVTSRYWKLWPLASWDRRGNQSRFRMLELWPLRDTPAVERNWAPLWTLYRRECEGDETGHHLLWGIYRQKRAPERFEWSLLKGLVGYKNHQDRRTFRLLFIPFGGGEEK